MSVVYDGKKLIPAPFISIQKDTLSREDGKVLRPVFTITVIGKIVAEKGSPNSIGQFHTLSGYPADEVIAGDSRLASILRKQEAIRQLFSVDGKTFEVQPYDGTTPTKCNPRIKRIEFPEDLWYDVCDYTIVMEADSVDGLLSAEEEFPRVSKVSEEWNIEILEENKNTYRLSHSLSATGITMYDETGDLLDGKEAWEHARDYVLKIDFAETHGLGLGLVAERMEAPGVLDATSLQAFNYLRTQSINETAGIFSASETWVCYDPGVEPPAINDYSVNLRYSSQDGKTSVSIEGSVTGLDKRNNDTRVLISGRWDNAVSKWATYVSPNLFTIAQAAVGTATVILNSVPLSRQVGLNQLAGTVTYQVEYDNRATPNTPGAVSENIVVSNSNAADVFAQIPILGRPYGPVLQSIGTVTSKKRTISIEVQMPATVQGYSASSPDVGFIISGLMPVSALGVFLDNDEESWNPNSGRYTRTSSFVWE